MDNNTTHTGDPLRPTDWDGYIGQDLMKQQLQVEIDALLRKEQNGIYDMLPHVLLAGPPGYGKTTLAQIIASKTNDHFHAITMPIKPDAFARFLDRWEGGVLLLDELHAAPEAFQKDLLDFLQDGKFRRANGKPVINEWVTVIGATTELDGIIEPLRDRFVLQPRFSEYTPSQLGTMIQSMASRLGVELAEDDAVALGRATGGTPRIATRLVRKAEALKWSGIDVTVENILAHCNIDADGLTPDHTAYLKALYDLGGVAGTEKITNMMRLASSLVRDLERLLKQQGLIDYSPQGRELTAAGNRKVVGDPKPRRRLAA